MSTLIRVELLKLRTVRLSYGLLTAAIGLTALFSVIESIRAGTQALPPLSTAAGVTNVVAVSAGGGHSCAVIASSRATRAPVRISAP